MIRSCGTKVRTGCLTCKSRHVKCDERRPSCQRCEGAGRICRGYHTPFRDQNKTKRIIVYAPPSRFLEWSELGSLERRALDYFFDRVMMTLSGDFESHFWSQEVIQLAKEARPIKHALLALSSMHERFSNAESTSIDQQVFAFSHYGRALKELMNLNYMQDNSLDFALVSCLLFSAFESLQGKYQAAMAHVKSGLGILVDDRSRARNSKHGVYRKTLTRFFLLMGTQIRQWKDPMLPASLLPSLSAYEKTIPSHPLTQGDAFASLEVLLGDIHQFADEYFRILTDPNTTTEMTQSVLEEYYSLKDRVDAWADAIESLSRATTGKPSARQRSGFMVLSVYQTILPPVMQRLNQDNDSCYDKALPDFWIALDTIEKIIRDQTPSPSSPTTFKSQTARATFSMSIGIVYALTIFSSSIPNVAIQEKALSLLKMCNRREGLWDSQLCAHLSERLNEIKATSSLTDDEATFNFMAGRKCVVRYRVFREDSGSSEERTETFEWSS